MGKTRHIPLVDDTFDLHEPADGARFMRLIEELKVRALAQGISHGIVVHKWVDSSRVRVAVFEGTPEGKAGAEALLAEGFVEGAFLGHEAEPPLSDVVSRVKAATKQLELPEDKK